MVLHCHHEVPTTQAPADGWTIFAMSQFRYFNAGENDAYEGSGIQGMCRQRIKEGLWLGGLELGIWFAQEGWKILVGEDLV
jgi:hypothetical protein